MTPPHLHHALEPLLALGVDAPGVGLDHQQRPADGADERHGHAAHRHGAGLGGLMSAGRQTGRQAAYVRSEMGLGLWAAVVYVDAAHRHGAGLGGLMSTGRQAGKAPA